MGPIQRQIRRAFLAYPDREFRTVELARRAYPRLAGEPQRKHRWAIVRAAQCVAKPGRPGVRKIAERFGVDPGTVQRISRPKRHVRRKARR